MDRRTPLRKKLLQGLAALFAIGGMWSCSDNVDESNIYVFNGETVASYLQNTEGYSMFYNLAKRVRTGNKTDSRIAALLASRGNYTVFAPSDQAVQTFIDSVYEKKNTSLDSVTYEMAEYIVRNAIIDHANSNALQTTDFIIGALENRSMDDRYIMISFDTLDNKTVVVVNEKSIIENADVECSNGYIQGVDRVLQPSNDKLPDLIKAAPNMKIFSRLLEVTGFADSMNNVRDEDYEVNHPEYGHNLDNTQQIENPTHRYYGYTAFVETDSVFQSEWGVSMPVYKSDVFVNWNEIFPVIEKQCRKAYPDATADDLTDPGNAVHQFVAYHLIPARMSWEKMIIHHIEMGYAYNNPNNLSIDCNEYYETMGGYHRLMKLTEGRQTGGKRINRSCKYDPDTYSEVLVRREGININADNGRVANNALNGFYYPIDNILVYDDDVPNMVLNERLRWDFSSLFSELITNGLRRIKDAGQHAVPNNYFERMKVSDESWLVYLPYYGGASQSNYQADEMNVRGQYDLTFRLPPVPFDGTWQFRICAPCNTGFGMAQFYIGKDANNLQAVGLPVDLRLSLSNPNIGWKEDNEDDNITREIDKNMLNHGYMKPPRHDGISRGGATVTESMRNSTTYRANLRVRKIVWTGNVKPNETMYLRVKSVLTNPMACFLLEYMEWVPKNVYNGVEEEDQW